MRESLRGSCKFYPSVRPSGYFWLLFCTHSVSPHSEVTVELYDKEKKTRELVLSF